MTSGMVVSNLSKYESLDLSDTAKVLARRPNGDYNYIENLVETKLKEVEINDRPRFYREYTDQYGIGYKLYDGIDDTMRNSFTIYLDELGSDHRYLKLARIIRKIDTRGMSSYEEEYKEFKKIVEKSEKERNLKISLIKEEEDRKREADRILKNVSIDMSLFSNNNNTTTTTTTTTTNNNNCPVIAETANVKNVGIDKSTIDNRVIVKIKHLTLDVDGNQLNNIYRKDEKYTLETFYQDFGKMRKEDQVEIIESLQKIISYNPLDKDYNIYINEKEELNNAPQGCLSLLTEKNLSDKTPKEYILSHKGRLVQPNKLISSESLNLDEKKRKEYEDELYEICNKEGILLKIGQIGKIITEKEQMDNIITEKEQIENIDNDLEKVSIFNSIIKKYEPNCIHIENKNSYEHKKLYEVLKLNNEDNLLFGSVIGHYSTQGIFTHNMRKFMVSHYAKVNYEIRRNDSGVVFSGHGKVSLYFKK